MKKIKKKLIILEPLKTDYTDSRHELDLYLTIKNSRMISQVYKSISKDSRRTEPYQISNI